MQNLTLEEQACNFHTMKHIEQVRNNINSFVIELLKRGEKHDQCKLESPEVELFTKLTPQLKSTTYGSEKYNELLKELKPALDHHYAKSDHHPEHFPNSFNGMDLYQLVELWADWCAAVKRHDDGNILKSIEINAKRFNISDQLKEILTNTAERYFE